MSEQKMKAEPTVGLPLPGTRWLTPDGAMMHLTKYEEEYSDAALVNKVTVPRYDYWSSMGGATSGLSVLPEGSVAVVLPTPEKPVVGSLWVDDANGDTYRLKYYDYRGDPQYSVSSAKPAPQRWEVTLPETARLVWQP